MKKFITYLGLLILILLFSVRCTNLDEKIYSQIPMDQYGKTTAEVNSLIAPIYTDLRTVCITTNQNCPAINETTSDMAIFPTRKGGDWWDGGVFKDLKMGIWSPQTSHIRSHYNSIFASITRCNQILYMIENSPAITDKVPYTCQVRAARAFWYYQLVDLYGNVPIVTDFTDISKPATKTRAEVYAFTVSELNAIKDIIRSDVSTASYGQFTKGAVYTILAKMYLNAQVWNPAGGAKWQDCIDACNVVMGLPYTLEKTWKNNFLERNETSTETILPVVNTNMSGYGLNKYGLHILDPIALGLGNYYANNGMCAMPAYVNQFDTEDLRYAGSFLMGPMINPATGLVLITAHGRPLIHRNEVIMLYNMDPEGWGQTEQEDGFRCFKWQYAKGIDGNWMENDVAIFRLADIYLMKAEALVRKGEDNVEATRLVNKIRERCFTDPAKLKASVTLDDIYLERRLELAWESYTRQDQIRFGTFLNPQPGFRNTAMASYRLLFPIPGPSIDANPNLIQNPGY